MDQWDADSRFGIRRVRVSSLGRFSALNRRSLVSGSISLPGLEEANADVLTGTANLSAADTVPGLSLVHDAINESEEADMMRFIDAHEWSGELSRRVQHYGWRYDYRSRTVTPEMFLGRLPPEFVALARSLAGRSCIAFEPDQAIVNEYLPRQGISPHVDCVECFSDTIASLSLGSGCVMTLARTQQMLQHEVHLPRRSMVVLQGDARYIWTHAIAKRKSDVVGGVRWPRQRRVRITFRLVRRGM